MIRSLSAMALAAFSMGLLTLAAHAPREAQACGCLSPPIPEVSAEDFAVNQQAEQIIFEAQQTPRADA